MGLLTSWAGCTVLLAALGVCGVRTPEPCGRSLGLGKAVTLPRTPGHEGSAQPCQTLLLPLNTHPLLSSHVPSLVTVASRWGPPVFAGGIGLITARSFIHLFNDYG